jgi:hypothetical protein
MLGFATEADTSQLRGEPQELKLGKLKDKALVNGRGGEKKSMNINKR